MDTGGFYRWHHDSIFTAHVRILTYIFYLNDVPVEHGGCTEFLMGKKIQPKKGTLILFPATWTYIHRGKKLEKGNKYIATGFVYGD
jgi:Rps23 Pro-64 3,4-dihydroxylase Tpa1-like proline 4-hydroxylase